MHLVYELPPVEYSKYRKHLLLLDQHSRYKRFGFHISDEVINKLCNGFETNTQQHKIFVIEDEDLNVVAAGHISLGEDTELAFSVLPEHQGQGMGSSLMKRCIEWCQNRDIKGGCMVCLSSNEAIKKLAKKHGILINQGGDTLADISIPESNPYSIYHEIVDSNLAKLDHLGKVQRKFAKMLTFPLIFSK
jgi:RimJ/RimL family protein N-acetyltransferase